MTPQACKVETGSRRRQGKANLWSLWCGREVEKRFGRIGVSTHSRLTAAGDTQQSPVIWNPQATQVPAEPRPMARLEEKNRTVHVPVPPRRLSACPAPGQPAPRCSLFCLQSHVAPLSSAQHCPERNSWLQPQHDSARLTQHIHDRPPSLSPGPPPPHCLSYGKSLGLGVAKTKG